MLRCLLPPLVLCACATTTPRFSQELAASFARDEMRRLETPTLEVYYPAAHRAAAVRLAARASQCLTALRAQDKTQRARDRAVLFLTSANFNNAYVSGQTLGEPLHSVSPLFLSAEIFQWFGLPATEVGDVSCHEMLHYAHFEQVENFWRYVNAVVGPVAPSQAFIERWFTEGVAQYYEGRLGRSVGRPHSPVYRGAFESFVAERNGAIFAGDLSMLQRELYPFSGAYLTSLPFVEWLVDTYGSEKLWEVMDLQGRSFFSPLGVTLRFSAVYGRSVADLKGIGELVDLWSAHLRRTLPKRVRPASQTVVRSELGQLARLASHSNSGLLALVTSGNEEGPRLRILESDGRVRVERSLIDLVPGRRWVRAGPDSFSGLSFTADGRFLFLLNDDATSVGDTRAQVWKVDARSGEVLHVWQTRTAGTGGSIHPDGSRYLYVRLQPDRSSLAEIHLASGQLTTLAPLPDQRAAAAPSWSPDGSRLIFSRYDSDGWNLVLRESDGALRNLTRDGAFNLGARWTDPTHVVFGRTHAGRQQVHRLDVDTGALERLTDAPWTLVDPAPWGDRVAFVNRDGSQWSLDAVPALGPQVTVFPTDDAAVAQSGAVPAAPPLEVEADAPYSALDGLFVPQLRVPGATFGARSNGAGGTTFMTALSASLSGRDRLAHHSWAVNGALTLPTRESTITLGYANQLLAPWVLAVSGGRTQSLVDTLWTTAFTASRAFFETPVALSFRGYLREVVPRTASEPIRRERYLGPSLDVAYSAGEATAYGGSQRALSLAFAAAAYPKGLGSSFDFLDLSASVWIAVPPPLLKRHALSFGLAARAMPGAPLDTLQVGGDSQDVLWASRRGDTPEGVGDQLLPGALRVTVRGYEDQATRASGLATASARYAYRFIIDRGFASTLYLFPSVFFRQLDLGAFANATATNNRATAWLRAGGASLSLRAALAGLAPVSLTYQFAWRFDLGLPPLHLVSFSLD